MNKSKGCENGVSWEINPTQFNPIIIKVESNKGEESYEYNLKYPNAIFGYDVTDVNCVNEELKRLIIKYSV